MSKNRNQIRNKSIIILSFATLSFGMFNAIKNNVKLYIPVRTFLLLCICWCLDTNIQTIIPYFRRESRVLRPDVEGFQEYGQEAKTCGRKGQGARPNKSVEKNPDVFIIIRINYKICKKKTTFECSVIQLLWQTDI